MKKTIFNILMLACLTVPFSCEQKKETDSKEVAEDQNDDKFDKTDSKNDNDDKPNIEKDSEFAVEAADGGLLEVRLAELALTNASSAQVKTFAKTMITEHGKANVELQTLAQKKNISLPGSLSDKCQKKYEDFAKKTGAEFDKDYSDLMVKDHKDDIDEFKKQAENGNDPELKSWAADKLSVLEHHLADAEAVQEAVEKANKK